MTSVCMATYNGERFIKQQIDSILPQLSSEDEIIVSDDGSSDKTLEILESYQDSRIKIFHHKKNEKLLKEKSGRNFYLASSNFENAIKHSSGDYIFLSDQDDEWIPDRVEKMTALLKDYNCVHCANIAIDENGNKITEGIQNKKKSRKSVIYNLFWTPFLGCCMAIRRDALKYILPFPKKCIGHDLWMGCLCAYKGTLVHIEEPLHKYRMHSNNVSPTLSKSSNSIFFMIKYRLNFIYHFYKRILFYR